MGGGLALVHEVENHGFHDNHGPVHDEAEVERAQAHQVGRHAEGLHHAQREEHAERNHAGHHQPGPPVAEQQQQHHHHDDAALDQVVHHRLDGLVDELGAVQKWRDDQSFGQGLLNLRHALFHAFDGGLGAGPLEHEHHAAHGFALAVARHGPVAHGVAETRGGHVAHQQRGVGGGLLDDDFAQVLQRGGPALAPNEKGVGAALQVGPAGVGVVVLHGGKQLGHGHAVGGQAVGIHADFVLAQIAAEAAHVHHAGYAGQLALHQPVLHVAQPGERKLLLVAFFGADAVLENLAQAGGDGGHARRAQPRAQAGLGAGELLAYQLPGAVSVHVVGKHDRNHRQPEARDGADFRHARHRAQL